MRRALVTAMILTLVTEAQAQTEDDPIEVEAPLPFDPAAAEVALGKVSHRACGTGGPGSVSVVFDPGGGVVEVRVDGAYPAYTRECLEDRFAAVRVAPFLGARHTVVQAVDLPPSAGASSPRPPRPYAKHGAFFAGGSLGLTLTGSSGRPSGGLAWGLEVMGRASFVDLGVFFSLNSLDGGSASTIGGMLGPRLGLGAIDLDVLALVGRHSYEGIGAFRSGEWLAAGCHSDGVAATFLSAGVRIGVSARVRRGSQLVIGGWLDLQQDVGTVDRAEVTTCTTGFLGRRTETTTSRTLGGSAATLTLRIHYGLGV